MRLYICKDYVLTRFLFQRWVLQNPSNDLCSPQTERVMIDASVKVDGRTMNCKGDRQIHISESCLAVIPKANSFNGSQFLITPLKSMCFAFLFFYIWHTLKSFTSWLVKTWQARAWENGSNEKCTPGGSRFDTSEYLLLLIKYTGRFLVPLINVTHSYCKLNTCSELTPLQRDRFTKRLKKSSKAFSVSPLVFSSCLIYTF